MSPVQCKTTAIILILSNNKCQINFVHCPLGVKGSEKNNWFGETFKIYIWENIRYLRKALNGNGWFIRCEMFDDAVVIR